MTTLLNIGASLGPHRRALGLSQRELAERLNTSQQQVARWEASGYRTASLERVAAAAAALGDASLAAEAPATYGSSSVAAGSPAPVRDLGEVVSRLRANAGSLRERFGLERVGVFGSFSRGDQRTDSDVDLLVDTADPGGIRFVEASLEMEQLLGRRVDLVRPELLRDKLRSRVESEVVGVW